MTEVDTAMILLTRIERGGWQIYIVFQAQFRYNNSIRIRGAFVCSGYNERSVYPEMAAINRKHKDRLFSFLFGEKGNKEWTLSLFNAVNQTDYTNPDDIEFTTMEDAAYMGMKNDVSFLLCYIMNVYEHQSTYNPNMPVRQLMYVAKLYDKYIQQKKLSLYGRKTVRLPAPKLAAFYNGTEGEDDQILKLSDAFACEGEAVEGDIEVKVRLININYGKNESLLSSCRPLKEYAWLVDRIRKNRTGMEIENAVDRAIEETPEDFIIRQFLIGHRAEVKDVCITEYNEAETMKMIREEGREEGRQEGREEGRKQGRRQGIMEILGNLVKAGEMTAEKAAEYAGMPLEQFLSH